MPRPVLLTVLVVVALAGCGRTALPANPTPPADWVDLEARYGAIPLGAPAAEVAGFLGKPGAGLVGYSTRAVKRKPDDGPGAVAANESSRYWASADGAGAVHVVFRADGKARLVELLRITPMGPPPLPPDPPAPAAP